MDIKRSTWAIFYQNGEILPEINQDGTINTMKSVDWSATDKVVFESQWDKKIVDITEFLGNKSLDDYTLSLRRRNILTLGKGSLSILMLLLSEKNKPINESTTIKALYWFPNGITHTCNKFRCVECSKLGQNINKKEITGIKNSHEIRYKLLVSCDGMITDN